MKLWPPIENGYFWPNLDIFLELFLNLSETLPKDNEKALTPPLKTSKMIYTPPNKTRNLYKPRQYDAFGGKFELVKKNFFEGAKNLFFKWQISLLFYFFEEGNFSF